MQNFKKATWSAKPPDAQAIDGGRVIVARNVERVEMAAEDGSGETYCIWQGESAIMSTEAYGAYLGALEAERKREQEIADETVLALIEEGSL